MENNQEIYRIIELFISASTPVLIAIFGVLLANKLETTKNSISNYFYWNNKWNEHLFNEFQEYAKYAKSTMAKIESVNRHMNEGLLSGLDLKKQGKEISIMFNNLSAMSRNLFHSFKAVLGEENGLSNYPLDIYNALSENIRKGNLSDALNSGMNLLSEMTILFQSTTCNKK